MIVARLSWRYIYWITASLGIFAWFLIIAFVPETRFIRSDAELGIYIYLLFPTTQTHAHTHTYTCARY